MAGENRRSGEGRKKQRLILLLQILDLCLIGRKTKDSLSHVPIGYMIACLTSGVISKLWRPPREMRTAKFFAALTSSLEDFIHKSLKNEQTECIQRIVCLEEDVLAVLPTGFEKSVIYQLITKVRMKKLNPSSGFKTSVVVVSPVKYIRKQQVKKVKKEDCGITAATIGESVEVDTVYGNAG